MIERLIDNWLDSASERAFQVPFCQSLLADGYKVVHLSRHCAMEMGKDILAIDPNGVPCAFQLKSVKGQKVTLSKYRADVEPQLNSLALGRIVHPAISSTTPHRSFLVINGELDEEVSRSIDDFNRARIEDGTNRKIEVVVKGQIFEKFKTLGSDFWPVTPVDIRLLLELYLSDPKGMLPKDKYHDFLKATLVVPVTDSPNVDVFRKSAITCAILSSYAINQFVEANNHFAEYEMWTLYTAAISGLAQRYHFKDSEWCDIYKIGRLNIDNSILRIIDELKDRQYLVEGNPFTDHAAYRVRVTLLIALASIVGIGNQLQEVPDSMLDQFIREFIKAHKSQMQLWGEYAIPQFLSYYLFFRMTDATPAPDLLLLSLLQAITTQNGKRGDDMGLPNPYYDADTIIPHLAGISETPLEDSFKGYSHSLEAILHLCVRTNWKQHLRLEWPAVTKVAINGFIPENVSDFLFWRCEKGKNVTKLLPHRKEWSVLRQEAAENEGHNLPRQFKRDPLFFLHFLIVNPHRLDSNGVRWIASQMR